MAKKSIEESEKKSCVYPTDDIIDNCSIAMSNFFIEVTRRPDFNYVEETEENKKNKELEKIVLPDKEPSNAHP